MSPQICRTASLGPFWAFVLLTLMALASAPGCAASKAMQQPGKKDVAVLHEGVPRGRVIAELGKPVWSQEKPEGPTDVFVFKQGYSKPVKAGRAMVHVAGDFFTFGLWEVVGLPTETLADGTEVKVQVDYDEHANVRAVQFFEGQKVMEPKKGLFARHKKEPSGSEENPPAGTISTGQGTIITASQDDKADVRF